MEASSRRTGKIVVVGSTTGAGKEVDPFAASIAQAVSRSSSLTLAGVVGPEPPFPTAAGLVFGLAAPNDRVGVVRNAAATNLPIVTLPLPDPNDSVRAAVRAGRVAQVSPLRGFAALETLRSEVRAGVLGRPYGIFASHRVRQGQPRLFSDIGLSLLHYVYSLLSQPVTRVQVTRASLFGEQPDAWFVLARCADDLILTVEFMASLAPSAPAEQQILVEATGSDTVLRAEPTRQAVEVYGKGGSTASQGWWSMTGYAETFVRAALSALDEHDAAREAGFLSLVAAVRQSAETGEPVTIAG